MEQRMRQSIRNRVLTYVARHKVEVRFFCLLIALAVVVGSAANIEDFINGFLDDGASVQEP